MVDIHSHILPGLDDGAESMEEALTMARMSVESGVYHMAATSHGNYFDYTLEEYRDVFKEFTLRLEQENIPLKLYTGMEIFLDEDAVSALDQKELLSLNQTDYLLVEFPFDENEKNVLYRINTLRSRGWKIVLAHPERYIFVHKDPELVYYLAEMGCALQINSRSIMGDFGRKSQILAAQFLNDGLVTVIASDAHDTEYRTPDMNRLTGYLTREFDDSEVKLWLSENPSRILKGMPVLNTMIE